MADTIMGKAGHPLDYMYIIMTKLCKFSKNPGRYWGMRVSFLKVANPATAGLPHFIERRISLNIHLRTAP